MYPAFMRKKFPKIDTKKKTSPSSEFCFEYSVTIKMKNAKNILV